MTHNNIKLAPMDNNQSFLAKIRKRPFYYLIIFFVIINIGLVATNAGLWFIAGRQKLFIMADFTSFYTGFKMVLNGDGANLYNLDLQAKYQQEIMGDIIFEGGLLPYLNPPILAVAFAPLALVSVNIAYYLWTIGELGLLIWLLLLINRLFFDWSKQERVGMTITILAFWPLIHTFILGQFSILFLVCLLQVYISMSRTKPIKAGAWLALLIIKPQALVIPGIMTLNKKNWRIAITAIISGIIMVIFSSVFIGFTAWLRYAQVLPLMSNNYDMFRIYPNIQYTLRGILANILGNSQAATINLISVSVFLGIAVIVWLLWLRGVSVEDHNYRLYFAFTILLSAFFSLHSYPHDDLILVLPAALFYDYLRQNNYPKKAYTFFIIISPLIFFIAAFTGYNLFGIFRPPVIIIMIFLTWIIYYMVRELQGNVKPARSQ